MPGSSARRAAPTPRQPSGAGVRLGAFGERIRDAGASARVRGAVHLALILLLAFLLARLTWDLLTPVGPFGAPDTASTPSRGADPALAARGFSQGGSESAGAVADSSGLALFGVRLGADPARATAIVGNAAGIQGSFAVGEQVAPGVTLASVGPAHIVLSRAGESIRLSLPASPVPSPPAMPVPATVRAPAEAEAVPARVDAGQLLEQTGLTPRLRDGQPDGYAVIPRGNAEMFRRAGLQPGDVLLTVNGESLTPERIGELEKVLRGNPSVVVTLQRGSERKTLTLQMEPP